MKSGKIVWAVWGSGLISMSVCIATVSAGPVSLPFFESFDTISTFEQMGVNYPEFTMSQALGGPQAMWYVDAKGLRTTTVDIAAPTPTEPAFSVTPNPKPTGEIVIKVDVGWNGADANPPAPAPGWGGLGMRLGRFGDTQEAENCILFHPGWEGPPGSFRIEGDDGHANADMGWTPALDVLHHVEIHSFPDGLFTIKVTSGTDPNLVYEDQFTNPFAYGSDIGLLSAGWGGAFYKNLSITLAGVTAHPGDFDGDGDVDGADFVAWQTNFPKASGATLAQGDADADGDVDGADFVVWQTNFPFTPGSGVTPVPEPSGFMIAGLGLLSAGYAWRKRRG